MVEREEDRLTNFDAYRSIVESATGFAVIALDRHGIATIWNPGAERILGWSADEILGRPIDLIFTPEDRASGVPDLERQTALERGEARDERWHLKKTGPRFWASGEMRPLRAEDGEHVGYVKILRDRTQEARTESETRRSRDELQVVTDALPILISFVDRNHVYRFNNRFYETWLGRPAESIVGLHMRDVLGEEIYRERAHHLERVLAGEDVTFDARMPYRDGTDRPSEIRYIPRRIADGTVDGFFVMVSDLTDRHRDQAALKQAEDRLRLALRAADTGIYDYDLVTGQLTWDDRTKALFGLPPEAEIEYERDYLGGVHPDDRDRAARAVAQGLRSRDGFYLEYRAVGRSDGVERLVAANGMTVFHDETASRFIGTVRDITASRSAEVQGRRLAAIVEQSTDFVAITDPDGTTEFVNEAGLRMVGLAGIDEARGRNLVDFVVPDDRRTVLETALPAARRGEFWEGDLDFQNVATGARIPVHYTLFPIRDAAGAPTGFGTVTRDLTERRRVETFRGALIAFGDRLQECRDTAEMAAMSAQVLGLTLGVERAGYGTADDDVELVDVERDWNAPGLASIAGQHRLRRYGTFHADLAQGREVVIADISHDDRTRDAEAVLLGIGVRALLNVPVIERGRVVALIFLHDPRPREWRPDEIAFVREIAQRTRIAVERQRAEEQRRESEEQFRVFAQAMPNHVWAADREGRLYWFNEQVYAYSGTQTGDLDGDVWATIVHPDDVDRAGAAWAASLASGAVYETEFRIRRADGAYRWFLVRSLPIREPGGAVMRWIGTNTDIEEQKANAAALETLNAGLEQDVEERTRDRDRMWRLSTDVMLVADFEARIVAVNPAWTTLFGWEQPELVGRDFMSLVHPDDVAPTLAEVGRLAEGITTLRFENRYRAKDGSHRWLSWTAVPEDGRIHAVGRDVQAEREADAALKRTEDALRQSQKMEAVGQLTGGLAHDFNNLLTGIAGSLELLQTRMSQGRLTDLDRYINAARGASKRAAALTHRLLAFSRQQTLDPKPTDVNALVTGIEELVRRTVGPGITIEVVGAPSLWKALVDPNQLENALLNLCINARDAMPDGGRITIETANKWLDVAAAKERDLPPGQYLSLCVTDTGTGMTPDVAARAFDPFFTTKPLGHGTGLGLSMIYGFARQSGGTVRIYTEVGQGTTMCLYLPRHYGTDAAGEEVPDLQGAPRAEAGETVLIVDDEPTVRMLVTEVLEDLGYTAIEAADGPTGLKVLQSGARIDLLITDVGLPGGMNGRQMADAGRVTRPDLKVLFITGYAENAVLGNGHLEPWMEVLTKPFVMDALASRIKEMIAGR